MKLLGFLNYCSKFVKNHSETIRPSLTLLRKDRKFQWKKTHQQALSNIKRIFSKAITLMYPEWIKDFILTCDANYYTIFVILLQLNDSGDEEIIIMVSTFVKGS